MINLSTKLTPIYVHVNKSSLALVLHQKLLQYNKKKEAKQKYTSDCSYNQGKHPTSFTVISYNHKL